jgi:hypothetical protein
MPACRERKLVKEYDLYVRQRELKKELEQEEILVVEKDVETL